MTKKPMHLDLKKGALHKELGIAQGKKIPAAKLAIKATDSPLEKKRKHILLQKGGNNFLIEEYIATTTIIPHFISELFG